MANNPPILYNTKPLKRGTDELINPRIDRVIFQLEDIYAEFTYASSYLKQSDFEHARRGLDGLSKVKSELKLIQRSISNHTE